MTTTPKATGVIGGSDLVATGSRENEKHAVLAFPCPGEQAQQQLVVDMTRMQYGSAGRGIYGENYFLGTLDDYMKSMKKICNDLKVANISEKIFIATGSETETRMKACAKKVWARWQNRESEGRCDIAGRAARI
jgi:hypothetical protein